MAGEIFSKFLVYWNDHYPETDIMSILPSMQIKGILTGDDIALINPNHSPNQNAVTLLLNVMPAKDEEKHRDFAALLKKEGQENLGEALEKLLNGDTVSEDAYVRNVTPAFGKFLIHLNDVASSYDVAIIIPMLKIQQVITSNDEYKIMAKKSPSSRATTLLMDVLPAKSREAHGRFMNVLRKNGMSDLGTKLESYLNEKSAEPEPAHNVPIARVQPVMQEQHQQADSENESDLL